MSPSLLHDCDWLALQLCSRYEHDATGRLTARRAAGRPAPPRLVLMRSRHGNLWRFAASEDGTRIRELSRLAGREPPVPADASPPWLEPERLEAMRRVLAEVVPLREEWRGPVFRFRLDAPSRELRRQLAARATRISNADPSLARSLAADFPTVALGLGPDPLCFAVAEGERWLSVCASAGGDPSGAVQAVVETAPSALGSGMAESCVAAWAEAVLEQAGVPLYSASWTNHAVRRLATGLGLELFGEECWIA